MKSILVFILFAISIQQLNETNQSGSIEHVDQSDILSQDSSDIIENIYDDPEKNKTKPTYEEIEDKEEKDELAIKKEEIEEKIKSNLLMKSDYIYTL